MRTDELDFELPEELIAQVPSEARAASRLLHYRKTDRSILHQTVADLPRLLRRGDLMVFNNTRVLAARFMLRKETGGRIEGLFLAEAGGRRWRVLLRGIEKYQGVLRFEAEENLTARCVSKMDGGECEIELSADEPAEAVLSRVGRMPLPPYIKRGKEADQRDELDRRRYQTVYAKAGQSVAAPTAGLHFTRELMEQLQAAGIERAFVNLQVGLGTFKPVTAQSLSEHVMHAEQFEIDALAAEQLNQAEKDGQRIVAVGTTSARVLESHPSGEQWTAMKGQTSIFIYPPYSWRRVGALMTNFHLPRSTLIALVAAMVGLEEQRRIYAEAIGRRYRFFSYGDAMLIE
jgi:S-adenosylmethionine:tRNA ribosyltransferase-isomerase